jgi:hypothetical protein
VKYLIVILFGLVSCVASSDSDQEILNLRFTNGQCNQGYLNSRYQLEGNFRVFYYGPKLQQIDVDLTKSYDQNEMVNHFDSVMQIKDPNLAFLADRYPIIAESEYVNIMIDTINEIGTNYLVNESGRAFGKQDTCIMHYPVIIENKYSSFFQIGYGDELSLIFEALNHYGKWAPISHPPVLFCGTGIKYVSLCPKEIVISALPITKGKYRTKGRLKLGYAISNEIVITIDTSTFDFPIE